MATPAQKQLDPGRQANSRPAGHQDAIMSVGLMGATGTLDVDGLTVDLIDVGAAASTNLIVNGDFELGDPAPFAWTTEKDARRVFPGFKSSAALELRERNSRAQAGLAIAGRAVRRARHLDGRQGSGLRAPVARPPGIFFLDDFGQADRRSRRRRLLPVLVGQFRLASRYARRSGAAWRAPGGPSDRQDRRHRRDSHRRRASHGVAQSRRRLVGAVSRRR